MDSGLSQVKISIHPALESVAKIYWSTENATDLPLSLDWLHPLEKEVLSNFKFPKKRNDWLLGRWTAKNVIKQFLKSIHPDLAFEKLSILAAKDGAPEILYLEKSVPAFISLSHSHGTGFCAVTSPGIKLGCDLEKIEPRSEVFVKDYFTEKEQAIIASSKRETHPLLSNLIWSAKESALKAIREGLRVDTRQVEVELQPGHDTMQWKKLRVTFLSDESVFWGNWRHSSTFVFTVLCGKKNLQPCKLPRG